jgi:two-component system NtrC family sensor kinase
VLRANGNRAIGTRVSKEVADRVLDNAMPWVDRAFVVKDWYLTAYDPIRDLDGSVIGMLYVGVLEAPFRALAREIVIRYAVLLAFGLAAALVLAFILAGRISQPIHLLSETAEKMKHGEGYEPLRCDGACEETEHLIETFNEMGATLKEREERLRVANEDLKSLNRSYMDMLGFVSHELKSPVSSIMNYAFLMNTRKIGELNEKQGRAAATIESNIRRISEMIRHYLNLSRIENAEFDPVVTDVKIREEVLDPLLQSVVADAEDRGIRIENRVEADVVVRADLNMMREAFENLVTNAIKYGRDAGRVSIDVKTGDDAVVFAVGNEGEGIPPDKIDTLFHKFSRVNGGGASRQKGTGLGLFITRHIVEAHGGTIEVESTPGTWTEFRFTLPLREIKETS